MNELQIIEGLQAARENHSALGLARVLDELTHGKLSQGSLVTYFKRAFPSIPLRVLIDAGAWHRLSSGGMSDDEFEELLGPHLASVRDEGASTKESNLE